MLRRSARHKRLDGLSFASVEATGAHLLPGAVRTWLGN